MRSVYWFASEFVIAVGVGLGAGSRAMAAEQPIQPIVPDLEVEGLKEAVRGPKADVAAVMTLTGRLTGGPTRCGRSRLFPRARRE